MAVEVLSEKIYQKISLEIFPGIRTILTDEPVQNRQVQTPLAQKLKLCYYKQKQKNKIHAPKQNSITGALEYSPYARGARGDGSGDHRTIESDSTFCRTSVFDQ